METGAWLMVGILAGGFFVGLWYILIRGDADLDMRRGIVADGLRKPAQSSSFSSARSEFERKLLQIEAERRRRNLSGGNINLLGNATLLQQPVEEQPVMAEVPEVSEVDDNDDGEETEEQMLERRRLRDEEWARQESEKDRRQLEEEEAALKEQQERLQKEQEAQQEKDRLEAEQAAEAARLAAERDAAAQSERDAEEAARQAELAAAEEQRLAEIQAAQEKDALERRKAANRALDELRARLEREGARTTTTISIFTLFVHPVSEFTVVIVSQPATENSTLTQTYGLTLANQLKTLYGQKDRLLLGPTRYSSITTRSTRSDALKIQPNSKLLPMLTAIFWNTLVNLPLVKRFNSSAVSTFQQWKSEKKLSVN